MYNLNAIMQRLPAFIFTFINSSLLLTTMSTAQAQSQQTGIAYPQTRKTEVSDNYHGTTIADPYRWLEDDNSPETKAWVKEQNAVTQHYLAKIPFRDSIKNRLEVLWNYPKTSAPDHRGNYLYFYKNDGLQNQAVLYRQATTPGATPEVFIDPNKLSADGTTALGTVQFSKDGKYAAYLIAKAGSDWQQAFVMDVATRTLLPDSLNWLKFTGLSWRGDGFYYSRYDAPTEASKLSKKNEFHKVYYHKVGTSQDKDILIHADSDHPLRNFSASVTEDERFVLLDASEGTSGNEIWFWDMKNPDQKEFKLLIKGFDYEPNVIDNDGDKLLVITNEGAPNYKVELIDTKNPQGPRKLIIPERKETLVHVNNGGGKLFAVYLQDAANRVYQLDYAGHLEREIKLPGIGTAAGFGGKKEDKEFYYTFNSYVTPALVYKYEISSGKSSIYFKPELKFDPTQYETKQVFFNSKDGTRIPMFLSYKKGIKLNGNNPVFLYGYGGFNIPLTPSFSVSNLFFMEQGGIFAQVTLRGGAEYGEDWHKAGMFEKKQNVFDDFIGAAEFLIKEKYTNTSKLAVHGRSNGGLLIGAVMTQRPDLFKVAIPTVGVLDMLRYQHFTIGWAWGVEYGTSDKEDQFRYLIKYSPLHNLKPGTSYPATMVTTGDHDDRVVPAHSFKFAATLQADNAGPNPTLIRIDTQAGHGAGKPTGKLIEESADIWAFVMYNLGMHFKN